MKNNRGFTLIELLAVIVILAIIAVIATPIIIGIINDTREDARLRSVELYASALERAYTLEATEEYPFIGNIDTPMSGEEVLCGIEKLDNDGRIILEGCMVGENGWYHFYDGKAYSDDYLLESLEKYAELKQKAYEEDQKKANSTVTSDDLTGLTVETDGAYVGCLSEYVDKNGKLVLDNCYVGGISGYSYKNGKATSMSTELRSLQLYGNLLYKTTMKDWANGTITLDYPYDLSDFNVQPIDKEIKCNSQFFDEYNWEVVLDDCTIDGVGWYHFNNGIAYSESETLERVGTFANLLEAAYKEDQLKEYPESSSNRLWPLFDQIKEEKDIYCERAYIGNDGHIVLESCGIVRIYDESYGFVNGAAYTLRSDFRTVQQYAKLLEEAFREDQKKANPTVTDPYDLSGLEVKMDGDQVVCENSYIDYYNDENGELHLGQCKVNGFGDYCVHWGQASICSYNT